MKNMKHKLHSESGQILLLVILVSTVLLTIGLSLSRTTTEETKIAKLEDDSKRALAAAEAGLEAALQKQSGTVSIDSLVGAGMTGNATIQTSQSPVFTTPLLQKDEQFTFYLADYTPADPNDPTSQQQFNVAAFSSVLKVDTVQPAGSSYCTENNGDHTFAVELTFVNITTGQIVARKLIDSCPTPVLTTGTVDKIAFGDAIDLNTTPSDLLFIKIISKSTSFSGAKLSVTNLKSDWPPQGKTIISTASTQTGVTKTIQLFQSYPQVPAEFMMSSF